MKMSAQTFAALESGVAAMLSAYPAAATRYRDAGHSLTRFRFDVLFWRLPDASGNISAATPTLYASLRDAIEREGLADSHLETALRRIVPAYPSAMAEAGQ